MLKISAKILLCLLLVMQFDITYIITMALGILAGFSITTGYEIVNQTFTKRKFIVRLMYTFGLGIIVWLYWSYKSQDHKSLPLIMAGIALFGDTIVPLIFRVGNKWLNKAAKKIENE